MKIINERPPNFEAISKVFPLVLDQIGILYCWDTTIYNPDGILVTSPLLRHEELHSKRQNGRPDEWWENYLLTSLFRFEEELLAHRAEYHEMVRETKDRNARNRHLVSMAQRLSGDLYGRCVTFPQAMSLIRER